MCRWWAVLVFKSALSEKINSCNKIISEKDDETISEDERNTKLLNKFFFNVIDSLRSRV